MKYRKLGNTGMEFSELGFGMMRLPLIDTNPANVDLEKAKELVRGAIDNGVNYIDTAYTYHVFGGSEKIVKEILADGYREKVYLGDKLSLWYCESYEDCAKLFDEQLERTGSEYFDIYYLHSVDNVLWDKAKKLRVFDLFDKLIAEGKIKHIAFSFHGSLDLFKEIIDFYNWEACLIQLNYMDTDYQAGFAGLEYAYEKGLGVVIMEPLKGGQLAKEPPVGIQNIWDRSKYDLTPAQRGIGFVLNRPEVTCVLSGMNTQEQLDQNMAVVDMFEANDFDEDELEIYTEVKEEFSRLIQFPCTKCQYCMPCPLGVDIPTNIDYYNMGHIHGTIEHAKKFYNRPMFEANRSTQCVSCGLCLDKCPQHLNIPEIMAKISDDWAIK